eukprot:gene31550-38968_t
MSISILVKKRVLVIGYGAAGSQLTSKLAKNGNYSVIVITPFEYQEVSPRMTRAIAAGGGPIGTELAADVKLRNKGKNVTVVHPEPFVVSSMTSPLPQLATEHLKQIGVDVITGERVFGEADGEVTLTSGRKLPCDLYISAHPTGGNSSFLPAESVDARGYVKVDDTLKVEGFGNVFALGDCSNYERAKSYPKIDDQMPVIVKNVNAVLTRTPLTHHVKGVSFGGKINGPILVTYGHGLDNNWAVGPDLPGCAGWFVWCCCWCGWPCSPPAGHAAAKIKSDFMMTMEPRKGAGLKH